MIRFEALNAKHGDALLIQYSWKNRKRLWIIDGGPKGVWKQTLNRDWKSCEATIPNWRSILPC